MVRITVQRGARACGCVLKRVLILVIVLLKTGALAGATSGHNSWLVKGEK
jgi:hypothetical protein